MSVVVTGLAAPAELLGRFCSVRQQTEKLCEPLTPEDMMVQSCAEASPAKWHLAHTTWFFETFILRQFTREYRPFHPDFLWLFNSYYNGVSDQPEKKLRASFSSPALREILDYRRHVEVAMAEFAEAGMPREAEERLVLGLHHEQQHQELLAYDIKNAFWANPLHPAYMSGPLPAEDAAPISKRWIPVEGGVVEIGFEGDGFSFDNEQPRHKEYLNSFQLASHPVTCAEYFEFMQDGGYERADLWLSEGWATVQSEKWRAPLYWHRDDAGEWQIFTLRGNVSLEKLGSTPVCHVSYFEADAFAHWAGKRLPTEAEWEHAASSQKMEGNFLEDGVLHPLSMPSGNAQELHQLFGDVWEWTASAYLGYPGFQSLPGALGDYNGKLIK